MKVTGPGSGAPAGRSRKTDKSGGGEAFKAQFSHGETSTAAAPAAVTPLAALSSLLAVQEAPDALSEKKQGLLHGHTLLDELRELQIGLVQGWVPEDSLRSIASMLDRPRPAIDDADLNQVLDDIELRAAVELAKLDRER